MCRYSEHHSFALSSEEKEEEEEMERRECYGKFGCVAVCRLSEKGGGEVGAGSIYKRAFSLNISHESCQGNKDFSLLEQRALI